MGRLHSIQTAADRGSGRSDTTARTLTVRYVVEYHAAGGEESPEDAVLNSPEVVAKQQIKVQDAPGLALCVGRSIRLRGKVVQAVEFYDKLIYELDLEYATPQERYWGITRVRGGCEKVDEWFLHDLKGKAFVNSAGDFFKPPPPRMRRDFVWRIGLDVPDKKFNPTKIEVVIGGVNQRAFGNWGKRKLLFEDFSFDRRPLLSAIPPWAAGDARYYYWEVEYTVRANSNGWNPVKVLDQGPRAFASAGDVGSGKKPNVVREGKGVAHGGSVLLDGSGMELDTSDPNKVEPVYRNFDCYEEIDFNFWLGDIKPVFMLG
jgi:hypothetical protein